MAFLVALIPVLVRFAIGWGLLDVPNAYRMMEHLVPSFMRNRALLAQALSAPAATRPVSPVPPRSLDLIPGPARKRR